MRIERIFDETGTTFEKAFADLMNDKVEHFIHSKYVNNNRTSRGGK